MLPVLSRRGKLVSGVKGGTLVSNAGKFLSGVEGGKMLKRRVLAMPIVFSSYVLIREKKSCCPSGLETVVKKVPLTVFDRKTEKELGMINGTVTSGSFMTKVLLNLNQCRFVVFLFFFKNGQN